MAVSLLVSASASAATLDIASGVLTYTAATGATNALTVSLAGGVYTIDDPGEVAMGLGAGALAAGCAQVDANTVTCPRSGVTHSHVGASGQASHNP